MIWANKTFDPEKAEVLYLFLETNRKTSTLMIDQHRLDSENKDFQTLYLDRIELSPETREQTNDMLIALTKLFYEKVFKNSPAWQKANIEWKRKKRKWGKDFEESFRAFIEGREKVIMLPPVGSPKESSIFLHTGEGVTLSIFKAERELMKVFVVEATKLIYNEFAEPLDFGVLIYSTEFLAELAYALNPVISFVPLPNGAIAIRMELI
jgi:hypothetical protein